MTRWDELKSRVRALHVNERNGYGPGDCHCEECCETMDAVGQAAREVEASQAMLEAARQVERELNDLDEEELNATPNGILLAIGGLANELAAYAEARERTEEPASGGGAG